MDFGDILLAQAKMMKYLEFPQLITDSMFGLFLVSWLVTRQIGLLLVTINVYDESPKHISLDEPEIYPLGPYDVVSLPRFVSFRFGGRGRRSPAASSSFLPSHSR